jgi:hypothetical protein
VLGRPGDHAGALADQARRRGLAPNLVGVAAAALAAVALLAGAPLVVPAGLGALAFAAFAVAGAPDGAGARARVGADAERKVGRIVERWARRNGAYRVVHGAELHGGGDADHVIFGPTCAVIETKYGRGPIRVARDGTVTVGTKQLRGNPTAQCERQRKRLGDLTRSPAAGFVCISDGTGRPVRHGNVIICGARQLPRLLSAAGPSAPATDAWRRVIPKT